VCVRERERTQRSRDKEEKKAPTKRRKREGKFRNLHILAIAYHAKTKKATVGIPEAFGSLGLMYPLLDDPEELSSSSLHWSLLSSDISHTDLSEISNIFLIRYPHRTP